jgi:hypothetical protein
MVIHKKNAIVLLVLTVLFTLITISEASFLPLNIIQLINLCLILAYFLFLIYSIFLIPIKWRNYKVAALVPFGINLCTLVLLFSILISGHYLQRIVFQISLPGYKKVIQQINDGRFPLNVPDKVYPISPSKILIPFCYGVKAWIEEPNILTVEFWTGGGFPVKHRGYLYRSNNEIDSSLQAKRDWPFMEKIQDNWWWGFAD